ncbi:MAG: DUF4317 domain-containing protein [Lachnospiraceae bacterium]|jgi:hypothetical protein|nr:DUF4317 domain-containing protein [Lachnospiraceae bacterium]MBQ5558595.1 DUF4317 domain-containing protein [Lachnospiraceae bacterium]MCR4802733.1 DUF4317 domain-containing protein [Lachnospiraceae bacterium]
MNKKDIAELKKRLTKTGCSFTKMAGCYIDNEKNKIVKLHETFLNLDEDEMHKYLDIAKKTMSGTVHNNLLELSFPKEEEEAGGKQQFLMGLRETKLKNEEMIDLFFDRIIETYDFPGNYLILLFHDVYDVITKTEDNQALDESEEVYEYLLCSICPVTLSKAALGYRADEHRIGSRIRDWVVGAPETGFIFPAFSERSTDIHSAIFYTRNTKEPHKEMMEDFLGCPAKRTATVQKDVFEHLVLDILDEHPEISESTMMDFQDDLQEMIEQQNETNSDEELVLSPALLNNMMTDNGVPAPVAQRIEQTYEEEFSDETPVVESLIDKKTLEKNMKQREQQALANEIVTLKKTIEEKDAVIDEKDAIIEQKDLDILSAGGTPTPAGEVIVRVAPEKLNSISSQVIEGKTCLVIPVEDSDEIVVNGERKGL